MTNLRSLDSATKYPSIATYHELDPTNGRLLETGNPFINESGPVFATEKVDGANARLIVIGDDWYIGSRTELLTAKGDRVFNPKFNIVDTLAPLAGQLPGVPGVVRVYFMEVYGHRELPAWKCYGDGTITAARCFDVAELPLTVLDQPVEAIATWRDGGGQHFMAVHEMADLLKATPVKQVPFIGEFTQSELPAGVARMATFMTAHLPATEAAIGSPSNGRPEGLVLRTVNRSLIRKARFESYDRTLNPRR